MNSKLEQAPRPEDEPFECPHCEGDYVLFEGDKLCVECGFLAHSGGNRDVDVLSSNANVEQIWIQWWDHRDSEYEGMYGENRKKMVGGFIAVYDFEEDF